MIVGKIHIVDEIGTDTTLIDVIRQVKSQKNATEFVVVIDSIGGSVDEGRAIYDYLKNLSVPVHTYAKKAYSIASVIYMAGQRRIVDQDAQQPIMIHLPWMEVAGSHDEISGHLNELKAVENDLVKFYADVLVIDKSTIQSLLKSETYLNAENALMMGFATEIKPVAVAMAKLQNNNEQESNWMNKAAKQINLIYNKLFAIKAELVLQDATGIEVVFPELNDGETPEAGATATVDGKPADGEFLMPDGSTLSFEKGELKEIAPVEPAELEDDGQTENADEPTEGEPATADEKDKMIAELEAKIAELEKKLSEANASGEMDDKLLKIIEASTEKIVELESKYQALAKSVGSDFQPDNKKEKAPTVKASTEGKSRAWQILNS